MSLLSYAELLELTRNGTVENCPESLVNGASIDITLAAEILIEEHSYTPTRTIDFRARESLKMLKFFLDENIKGYVLAPGEFILAASQQIFNLPPDLACEYKLKSSMARIGLNHLNAGFCDPTWNGSALTLELVNTTRYHSIRLRSGDRVGQVVFCRCAPVPEEASYALKGRYNRDAGVRGIKP